MSPTNQPLLQHGCLRRSNSFKKWLITVILFLCKKELCCFCQQTIQENREESKKSPKFHHPEITEVHTCMTLLLDIPVTLHPYTCMILQSTINSTRALPFTFLKVTQRLLTLLMDSFVVAVSLYSTVCVCVYVYRCVCVHICSFIYSIILYCRTFKLFPKFYYNE